MNLLVLSSEAEWSGEEEEGSFFDLIELRQRTRLPGCPQP